MKIGGSTLNVINNTLVSVYMGAYPIALILVFLNEPTKLWPLIVVPALGFGAVTLWRKAVNAPRPYDNGGPAPSIKREGEGCSFPSRHSFSAFCIATCWAAVNPWVCAGLLVLASAVAVLRVIGGVHFPRDVIAGAALGVVIGAITCCLM